jgi:glycerol-3-phosphate dehydrogenase
VERGEVASGATGRNHCLLHSGARYCVQDPESACDCIRENVILQRIWPNAMECNGGLFVALAEEDLSYRPSFLEACAVCGIPARELKLEKAFALEPNLNARTLAAVLVPDGVFEPYRLCLAFLASAQRRHAEIKPFHTVRKLLRDGRQVTGAVMASIADGSEETICADLVINAAGAWAGYVAAMADVSVPLAPCAGVLVTVAHRWNHRVLNRMRPPSDGDVVLPIRQTSIVGTTSWMVDSADGVMAPADQVARMLACGDQLLPGFAMSRVRGVMAATRPLVCPSKKTGRALSRESLCIDHAAEGAPGLLTVIGGKTTTARGMAQHAADMACSILGVRAECRTMEVALADYHEIAMPAFRQMGRRAV